MIRSSRLAACAAALALTAACTSAAPSLTPPPTAAPRTATVARAAVSETLAVSGAIEASSQYRLSFRVPGRLARVAVAEGQRVEAQQVLAELDAGDLAAAVASARAAVASAQARHDQLLAGATAQDLADARRALDQARAAYEGAKAAYRTSTDGLIRDLRALPATLVALKDQIVQVQFQLTKVAQPIGTPIPPTTPDPGQTPEPTPGTAKADARLAVGSANQAQASRDLAETIASGPLADAANAYDAATRNVVAAVTAFDAAADAGGETGPALAFFQSTTTVAADASARLSASVDSFAGPVAAAQTSLGAAAAAILAGGSRNELNLDPARFEIAAAQTKTAEVLQTVAGTRSRISQATSSLGSIGGAVQGTYPTAQSALARVLATARPADVAAVLASVESATAGLRAAEVNLEGAILRAPAAGLVLSIAARPGEIVSGPLLVLNADRMKLRGTVGESDVARLRVGQTADVVFGTSKPVRGTVAAIDSGARTAGTPLFGVDVALDAGDGLRPGMTGSARITVLTKDGVLAVPSAAIRANGSRRSVQVLRDGRAVSVDVSIGIANDTLTEVLSGLREGELVVLARTAAASPSPR